jgi:hypothetical protein
MAHQHPVGPRPDIFAEQLGIAGKPAIGDDNRTGAEFERFAVLVSPKPAKPEPNRLK